MFQRIAIAIGAGVASALLFVVPGTQKPAAMALAFLGSLPIMLATMGFGTVVGLSATFAGAMIIALALPPLLGVFFAITVGLPAFWLAWLAGLSRDMPAPDETGTSVVEYYPVGRLLAWMAALSSATSLILLGVMALRRGGVAIAIDEVADRIAPVILSLFGNEDRLPAGFTSLDFARAVVFAMPPIAAAIGVVVFGVNLWLAGRVSQISGLLPAHSPDIPYNLRMPRDCLWVLGAAIVCSFLGLVPGLVGSTVAAAFAMAYALQGLAAIHGFLRGNAARMPVLAGIYLLTFILLPWPLIVASAVGIFDAFIPLRRQPAPAVPIVKP